MKSLAILGSLVFASFTGAAQGEAKTSLKALLLEAPTAFEALQAELSAVVEDDTFYRSMVTLDGSHNNEIAQLRTGLTQYHAYVADSATKSEAQRLLQLWRKQIKAACPDYEEEVIHSTIQKRTLRGYHFTSATSSALYSLSIVSRKRKDSAYYLVLFTITQQKRALLEDEQRE